ncbi:MAG: glutaredoxin 3 [Gammaproteobacteria bacterium]|nr:glutaredoxin 3 [Gammaproteobacteria bacterium]
MAKVVIYSTAFCPYCSRARQLLDKKNVDYIDIRIDKQPEYRSEMESRSGNTSVPQIFIDDYHVGGFDDLSELEFDDKLDEMLGIT